jgi:hypothetical protein
MNSSDENDFTLNSVLELSITEEFPLHSQTSKADKIVLLKVRKKLQNLSSYSYLEIGSYLGGSLTPFLKDPQCIRILSIDQRGRQQPDERGLKYNYTGVTHQTMIDNLKKNNFNTSKLETFDGSISEYYDNGNRFDLMFVDGEHTDWACFRDFIHGIKFLAEDSIVVFHDSSLIYKSLKIIQEYMLASGKKFKFIKINDSEMSCLFLNNYASHDFDSVFSSEKHLPQYYASCESTLFFNNIMTKLTAHLLAKYFIIKSIPKPLIPLAQKLNQLFKRTHPKTV